VTQIQLEQRQFTELHDASSGVLLLLPQIFLSDPLPQLDGNKITVTIPVRYNTRIALEDLSFALNRLSRTNAQYRVSGGLF
jgi:hypothetical protein